MYRTSLLLTIFAATVTLSPNSFAQKQKLTEHIIRILPAGEAPPLKIIERGDQRIEAEAPAGTIPPRTIHIITPESQTKTRLSLGNISAPAAVRLDDTHTIKLSKAKEIAEDSKGADVWLQTKLPTCSRSLLVVFKKPKAKNWDEPVSLCLRDDSQHFPAGSIRIINTSPFPIYAHIGKKRRLILKPGRNVISKGKAEQHIALYVKNTKGKLARIFLSSLTNSGTRRTNILIHATKPRRYGKPPVAVRIMPESAPAKPSPKRR